MKNYCLDENEAGQYIVDVCKCSDGTLTIQFADGRIFKHIAACSENFDKIIAVQEEQAKKGIQDYAKFKNKERTSRAKTVLSGLGILSAGIGASFIPMIHDTIASTNPVMVYAGIGAVAVLGTIPAYAKLCKDHGSVKELDMLRFREEHLADLQNFRQYPNALSGLNARVSSWIQKQEDPFCILHMDSYSLQDLERIIANIETEKEFNFSYQKKK